MTQPPRALPAGCYRDPEFFALELEHVLRPGWHAVARTDELPQSGDYRSFDLFGEPLLLVRDEQQRIRAYSRVCLHRAHPIVEGEGNTQRFVCPYHRWTYDLSGSLRTAPLMEDAEGFDRADCRLPELPLEEWQGFVLVSLDADAEPFAPSVAELDKQLTPWGFGDLRLATSLDYPSPWNWKVMVDNFMESYHHLGPHAETLQRSNPAKGTHAVPLDGEFALLENPGAGDEPPFWVAQVFPTLLLSLQRGDTPFGTWYEMRFDGPDHLDLRIHVLLPEAAAADPATVEAYRNVIDRIHQEDIPVCRGVQRGIRSTLWRPGRLNPREETLTRFHRFLARRLGSPALGTS